MGSLRAIGARPAAGIILAALASGLLLLGARPARAQAPASSGSGSTITYGAGWNLVAFPTGTDLSKLNPTLYTMQPGDTDYETIPSSATQSGFGYWAYFSSSTNLTLGAPSDSFYAVLAPEGQYFMVGNPSSTMPAVVTGADSVATYDPVAGYGSSPILNAGQGAWVVSSAGGLITVTPTAVVSAPPAGAQPPAGRFYGAVTVSGAPATSGTPVTAFAASGATCGSTTVGAAPASASSYALDLIGSDSGCTTSGSALTFSVGGAGATVSGSASVPDVSGAVKADLAVP